jgi:hypothetical protein
MVAVFGNQMLEERVIPMRVSIARIRNPGLESISGKMVQLMRAIFPTI